MGGGRRRPELTRLAVVVLGAAVALALTAATPTWGAPKAKQAPVTSFYVDGTVPACSNTGPGTADAPFCTIAKGVSALGAGVTLYIGNGSYPETIKPTVSGTASAPVTITAWPGRSPTVTTVINGAYISKRSYVTLSGIAFSGTAADGIYVTGSDHITISGNTVTGSGHPAQGQTAPGISLRGSSASLVTGNTSDRNSDTGIYLANGTTGSTVSYNEASFNAREWQRNANGINVVSPGNTIIGNVTHDNEDSGIQFYTGGDNNLATLNVTYNNGDHGIDDFNVTGGRIIGNTVFHNCTSGINVEGTSGNYTVKNNIAVDNAVYPAYHNISCSRRAGNIGIWDSAPSSTLVDHNLVWLSKPGSMYVFGSSFASLSAMQRATGQEQAGVQADPGFAGASSGNLQLTEGSAAIDRGDSGTSGEQSFDILGASRVRDPNVSNAFASGPRLYDDLGAYEFQPGAPPVLQPPTAALTVTPTSGAAPLQISADASASSDPQGQALTYSFAFGDGASTGSQSSAAAAHTYGAAGSYTVTVTVTDAAGLSSTASQTVTASTPAPQPPTASLSVTPASGTAPLQVSADASASSDPQGQALSYSFDFGDGTSTGAQPAPSATHSYGSVGTFTVSVTVTDTSGLSSTASQTVTVGAAAVQPPVAQLSVTPTSGTGPLQVIADASGSTDPQGQSLSYNFAFGDGTSSGTQTATTAPHTYNSAGTFALTVTVTNTAGLSATASRAVTVVAPVTQGPPAYVSQIATNYSTNVKTTGSVTVWRAGGVKQGDLVVVTLQLNAGSGTVTATDDGGSPYTVASDVSDGAGHRLVVLSGVASVALAVNQKIYATFPSSAGYRMMADEFSGVTRVDQTASATGTTSGFTSGSTATTTAPNEVAFSAVALVGGTGNPAWAAPWRDMATYAVGSTYLGRAYQIPSSTGTFAGSGTGSGSWLAATVTFMP